MIDKHGNELKIGDNVRLLEMPDTINIYGYKLTIGNVYKVVDFEGSNVITTSDNPKMNASYNMRRVEKINDSDMTSAHMGYL